LRHKSRPSSETIACYRRAKPHLPGELKRERFLTALAQEDAAASTQNQALNAFPTPLNARRRALVLLLKPAVCASPVLAGHALRFNILRRVDSSRLSITSAMRFSIS
jgi:hypothetical protein